MKLDLSSLVFKHRRQGPSNHSWHKHIFGIFWIPDNFLVAEGTRMKKRAARDPQPRSLLFSTIHSTMLTPGYHFPGSICREPAVYLYGFDTLNNLLLYSPGYKSAILCLKKNLFLKMTKLVPNIPCAAEILFSRAWREYRQVQFYLLHLHSFPSWQLPI